MTILRLFRPLVGNFGKKLVDNGGWMTKYRFVASKAASESFQTTEKDSVEDFLSKNEITINGKRSGDLKPILNFDDAGFPDSVTRALKSKFDTPSVIQSVSWPYVLAERDLVGIARTGSGKTLSFLLPALVHITRQNPLQRGDGPMALVLCPTRELAQQVQTVADEWSKYLSRIQTVCIFGGANRVPQEQKLQKGVEIVVATPGRLNDFLGTRATNMNRCSYLVLDEADRMLDMGFEPQIRQIIDQISKDRQTVMYSATWPSEVRSLAADFMKDFVHVKIGSAELAANKNITQHVHISTGEKKFAKFWTLLDEMLKRDPNGKILVFCQQKRYTERLEVQAVNKGMRANAIHGDISQASRDRTLRDFRSGRVQILFATDVAARGLDVDDVKCVINYDHPPCVEDYVHRIGRTARRDCTGESHTILTEDEDAGGRAKDLIKVLKASNQPVSAELQNLANMGTGRETQRRWGSFSNRSSSFNRSQSQYDRYDRRPSYSSSDRFRQSRYDRFDYDEENDRPRSYDRNSRSRGYSNYNDTRGDRRTDWNNRGASRYEEMDDFDVVQGSGRK